MPAPSLVELAQRACIRSHREIHDYYDLPYSLIRPILQRVESPEQLAIIEKNCPQIVGEDAELWREFIKRDIKGWETKPHEPKDPKNWAKVYRKLRKDAESEMLQSANRLKAALDSIKNEKEQNLAQLVDRAKLPPRRPTSRQIASTSTSKHFGVPSVFRRPVSKSVSARNMAIPMHELKKRTTKVMTAPPGFIADQKRKAEQGVPKPQGSRPSAVPTTSRPQISRPGSIPATYQPPTSRPSVPAAYQPPISRPSSIPATYQASSDLQERENRLRALTQQNSSRSQHQPAPINNTTKPRTPATHSTTSASPQRKRTLDSLEPNSRDHSPPKRSRLDVLNSITIPTDPRF